MGDRTYVSLTVHPEDLKHPGWKNYVNVCGESMEQDEPNYWYDYECNYANWTNLEILAQSGVRFAGEHGPGGEYPATDFFADGKDNELHSEVSEVWNYGAITVKLKDSAVDPEHLKKQIDLYNRHNSLWKEIRASEPKQEPS